MNDNTQNENTQTENAKPKRVNAPKRVTKKSIIRQMLLEELHSEEVQHRISAALAYVASDDIKKLWDKYAKDGGDDGLITFAVHIRNERIPEGYKGYLNKFILTTRAFLLLHAYRKSPSHLSERAEAYDSRVNEAAKQIAWYKQLSDDAKRLRCVVENAYNNANNIK